MEEIEPQRVAQFSIATDDGYTVEHIKTMELEMLKVKQGFPFVYLVIGLEVVIISSNYQHMNQLVYKSIGYIRQPKPVGHQSNPNWWHIVPAIL